MKIGNVSEERLTREVAAGEVRETSADALLRLPGLVSGSVARLREALGLSSTDGVRPKCKKP